MTNNKLTKRTLLSSVLSIVLCVSMLLGTTYAWFTDSVTSGSNVIQSGNLDLEVQYTLDGENWANLDGATNLFQTGLWEPGHTEVVVLKISNEGSLALKYGATMNLVAETVGKTKNGDDIVLSEILTVSTLIQQTGMVGDIAVMLAFINEVGVLYENTSLFNDANVLGAQKTLASGDSHYLIIKVDMAETVGNEANHDGVNKPSIDFGLNIYATQDIGENDSFGNDYDALADYAYFYSGTHELNAALAPLGTDVVTADGEDTVVNITGGFYDALSGDCAVWAKNGATVNISGGTFVHNGEEGVTATPSYHYDMIYAGANGGKINISGGIFYARNGGVWLLNERDNDGEIVVTGGTFINWDPANNDSEGAGTSFVAPGYVSNAKYLADGTVVYTVVKDTSVSAPNETTGQVITEAGTDVTIKDTTINNESVGIQNDGKVTVENTDINAGNTNNYASINRAETVYNNVDIVSAGGGIGVNGGAKVTFNSGKIYVNSSSTSGRYVFYVAGEGSELTINGGEFSFNTAKNNKRAYVYASEGTTVYITGGTFGKASTRSGYNAGIMGEGTVIITGGTFGFNPTQWVAEGYQAVKDGANWIVIPA